MRNAMLLLFALCVAQACGNKGPLYHPSSKPPPKTQAKPAAPPAGADTDEKRQPQ